MNPIKQTKVGDRLSNAPSRFHVPTRQSAVAELGQSALSGHSVEEVLRLAVDLVCEALDLDMAFVLQKQDRDAGLLVVAGRGWMDFSQVGTAIVTADTDTQFGYTLMTNEPVLVEDLPNDHRFTGPSLLTEQKVMSGMSVVIWDRDSAYGVLCAHSRSKRVFTVDDSDFLRSVANIIASAIQNERAFQQNELHSRNQDRRIRYQAALAKCAQILLVNTGEHRLEEAVEALLTATQATYVFLERNVIDAELGFCSQTLVDIEHSPHHDDQRPSTYWELVPWEQMPTSRRHLEAGVPFFLIPANLSGVEYELYEDDPHPVKSELDIPIFVNGNWAGLIGFADTTVVREWTEEDLSLLTTAATMIGAFWEREVARDYLEQLIKSKDEFLASVSHELRTPLTAVVGFGQILRDASGTLAPDEHTELLETVVRQGTDLTNIVNDLLVAARADIGKLHVTKVPVNLRAQTAQVLESFEHARVAEIKLLGGNVWATADPDRVRQIIRNLLSNALRYGGDRIHVEVRADRTAARVLVCDNGPPISETDHERIFRSYQRAHDTPGVTGSLGLGLAISRQLARLMDGDLTYEHRDEESVFELTLRRASQPVDLPS